MTSFSFVQEPRLPVDGTVVEGAADVYETMITGESRTVSKGPGG